MGSNCTTPKSKGIIPSRKTKGTISPLSTAKSADKCLSFSEQNKFLPSKVPSFETIPNIESLETLSIRSKSMTTEVIYEDSPKLIPTSSPTTLNALHIPDHIEFKKPSQYKKGPSIGKGCYGEVYECLNLSSGELHAAKSVKVYGDKHRLQNYIEAIKKEIIVLQGLSHPNVVNYFTMEVSEFKEENYTIIDIIAQHVSGGSIKALLDKFDKLDERVVSHYTKQILEGLAYIHSNEIVHRNIKSSNVLIDACGTAKLADFGGFKSLEKFVILSSPEKNDKPYSTPKNKFCWQAPEVVMKKSQGKSSDIWSVGCVVLEMLTGTLPWKNTKMTLEEVYKQIISGGLPPFPENISDNCRDFLINVFMFKPEDRPTAVDLLEHPFIREQIASLTCLDYDSMQTFQMQQTLMGQNSLDDIFAGAKRNQESNQTKIQHDPSFGDNINGKQMPLKRMAELTIHVGQSKIIPNHLNKPVTMMPTLVKLSSRTSIEDSSICKNSWEVAKTPGRRKEFEPELGGNNSVSTASKTILSEETARFGSQTSIIQTPIKNTFFFSPSATLHADSHSSRRMENSSSFAIQASLNKSKLAEKTVCDRDQNGSPIAQETLRKSFEEKMQEELDADKENVKPHCQNLNKQAKTQRELDQEKMEMRRRFEQEMQQELNGLEVSRFDR